MNTKDLKEIISLVNGLSTSAERSRCLIAVDDEPEVPGAMPDEMWNVLSKDRAAMENAIRAAVQRTKSGIRERILKT